MGEGHHCSSSHRFWGSGLSLASGHSFPLGFLEPYYTSESLTLKKYRFLRPCPSRLWFSFLKWSPVLCICQSSPEEADAQTLWKSRVKSSVLEFSALRSPKWKQVHVLRGQTRSILTLALSALSEADSQRLSPSFCIPKGVEIIHPLEGYYED